MSYDLEVYAESDSPLEKAVLVESLLHSGWHVVFLHSDAFWKPDVSSFLPSSGPLEEEVLLGGWLLDDDFSAQLSQLVTDRNFEKFKQFVEETEVLAVCYLSLTCPYEGSAAYSKGEWENMKVEYPERAELLSKTHSYYYLSTRAGRSPWSFDFQEAAWQSIAQVTGGVAENLQEDLLDEEATDEEAGI